MPAQSDTYVKLPRSMRFLVSTLMVVVLTVQAVAVAGVLAVNSEEKSGLYRLGQEIVFAITSIEPIDLDKVSVTVRRDGFEKVTSFATNRNDQTLEVRLTPKAAGWYLCEASLPGNGQSAPTARAGVVVSPETIAASMPEPEDFEAFWNVRRAALKALPLEAELKRVEDSESGIECFDLDISCPGTKPVRGYYARPQGAEARSCPALLYLRAAGVAGHWCRASARNATSLAREYGAIVVDINAHGMLNGQAEEYYQNLEQHELRGYWKQGADDRDAFYFVGMYVRLLRAVEFLATREPWDGRHLVTMGESQGGGQALAAAGLDGRVSAVAAVVPAMCDFTGPVVQRLGGWPQPVGRDVEGEHTKRIIDAVRYCDNANLAPRSRAETLIFVGLIDTTCSAPGIFAAYNNLPGAKRIVAYPHKPHNGLPEEDRWIGDIGTIRKAFIQRHLEN